MPTPTSERASPPLRYQLLVGVLSPLLFGYTLWRACKDGGLRYFRERLGWYRQAPVSRVSSANPGATRKHLWVHAASVGEVITVLPLIRALLEQQDDTQIRVTTGTPTGAAVLQQQNLADVHHQYLPVDFPGACKRFVRQLPTCEAWIVETEIWPWLYAHCERRTIPLTIINGRLSDKTSTQATGLLASSYRRALHPVRVLARSQQDQDRFLALGTQRQHIQIAGNLKYGSLDSPYQDSHRLIHQPYVLAASTHQDEELRLALAWHALATAGALLVIAPRHPERGDEIKRQLLANGIDASQRSKGETPRDGQRVYLADTLGEMQVWYAHANGAFVGGSLIQRGGHNMLEPARHACPTIVGPHTANFDDMMALLGSDKAIAIAADEHDVARFLWNSTDRNQELQAMGQRAKRIAIDVQGTLARYLSLLGVKHP